MAASNFSGPICDHQGDSTLPATFVTVQKNVTVTIENGAAAGTFTLPTGTFIQHLWVETPTAIPGTPTNVNLRIGSAANGQQYVADVDVKAQGLINTTLLYAGRNPATTVHFTVASSGGTAASQDGVVTLRISYVYTG